jgi:microcystin-dependent protein
VSDQFVAEIRIFGFNFAPTGWAQCNGQLLPISQNTALFSLLGTTYGGDGKTTFALPDLQGNAAMQQGQGQGLSLRDLGEVGGVEAVTLLVSEIPVHTHVLRGNNTLAESGIPTGNSIGRQTFNMFQTNSTANLVQMAFEGLPPAGGGLPHNNLQPYLTLNYCIALQGIFPQRP